MFQFYLAVGAEGDNRVSGCATPSDAVLNASNDRNQGWLLVDIYLCSLRRLVHLIGVCREKRNPFIGQHFPVTWWKQFSERFLMLSIYSYAIGWNISIHIYSIDWFLVVERAVTKIPFQLPMNFISTYLSFFSLSPSLCWMAWHYETMALQCTRKKYQLTRGFSPNTKHIDTYILEPFILTSTLKHK